MVLSVLRTIWGSIRAFVVPALLATSLLLNVLIFVSSTVFNAAAAVIGGLTAGRTIIATQAKELATATGELKVEKAATRELQDQIARQSVEIAAERRVVREVKGQLVESTANLAASATALSTERAKFRQIQGQLAEARGELVRSNLARKQEQKALLDVTQRVSQRSARSAARELAAMPAESIPVWGTAIIVGVTAIEINDLCQTLIDMTELRRTFDPEVAQSNEELTVCAMEIPSRSELWEIASNAPERAWGAAIGSLPELNDLKGLNPKDIDWSNVERSMTEQGRSVVRGTGDWLGRKGRQIEDWWKN